MIGRRGGGGGGHLGMQTATDRAFRQGKGRGVASGRFVTGIKPGQDRYGMELEESAHCWGCCGWG